MSAGNGDGPGYDRSPPYSLEAEISVIGAMLIDVNGLAAAIETVQPNWLFREAHRRLFRAMVRMFERGTTVDIVTLADELKDRGELESVGGHRFLAEILEAVPTAANVEHHAKIVREKAMLRRLIDASSEAIRDAYDPGESSVAEIIERHESRVLMIADSSPSGDFVGIKEALWPAFERLEEWQKNPGEPSGLPSGFRSIDRMTAGFQPGDLILVAARPSMGKTALSLAIADRVSIDGGKGVAIESLEMSREALTMRLLAARAGIDMKKMRLGEMSAENYQRLATAAGALNNAPIWMDDRLDVRVSALRSRLRRLARQEQIDLVVVDYLQLLEGDGDNRVQQVSTISRTLKTTAVELGIPMLVISQLSRGPENRTDKRPQLSDLRDSGSLEQDADVVIFLYRPDYYSGEKAAREAGTLGETEVTIAKQRNGPIGTVKIHFDRASTQFTEKAHWNDERRAEEAAPWPKK